MIQNREFNKENIKVDKTNPVPLCKDMGTL